jgi:chromosome segregation ATPase
VNAESERRNITGQIAGAAEDEQRNRQNIGSLSGVSGQQQVVQDYARRLTEQETQIAKLRERQSVIEQQQAGLQTQLNSLVDSLDF